MYAKRAYKAHADRRLVRYFWPAAIAAARRGCRCRSPTAAAADDLEADYAVRTHALARPRTPSARAVLPTGASVMGFLQHGATWDWWSGAAQADLGCRERHEGSVDDFQRHPLSARRPADGRPRAAAATAVPLPAPILQSSMFQEHRLAGPPSRRPRPHASRPPSRCHVASDLSCCTRPMTSPSAQPATRTST